MNKHIIKDLINEINYKTDLLIEPIKQKMITKKRKKVGEQLFIYFGKPGCGKTTKIVADAIKAHKSGIYENIYSNIPIDLPYVTYIKNEYIGKYQLENGLLLIDEGTVFADSREYKNFKKELSDFFMLHRHYKVDCRLYCQKYNGIDLKIRNLCTGLFYMYKPLITGKWITKYHRIPYKIMFPHGKDENGKKQLGDIEEGYYDANIIQKIFAYRLRRKKYYKYFNSWSMPKLPPLPQSND